MIDQAARWIADGIDLIQLREKDLPASRLAEISRNLLKKIDLSNSPTKLLINSRADVALATAAHGVHLTSSPNELKPHQIRALYASANLPEPIIGRSCHTLAEVEQAHQDGADAILFGPVFSKTIAGQTVSPAQGLGRLQQAVQKAKTTPIYALGGITQQNIPDCLEAGAQGIAGIRLFHTP